MTQKELVDQTDLRILDLIRRDARLSFREIGKQLNLSTGTVSDRIKNMQANGVIKGFVTAVDPEVLGYSMTMIVEIRLQSGVSRAKVEKCCEDFHEVCCIHQVTGDIDFMVMFRMRDQHHAAEVLERIRETPGVASIESHVVLAQKSLCGKCGCDCAAGM